MSPAGGDILQSPRHFLPPDWIARQPIKNKGYEYPAHCYQGKTGSSRFHGCKEGFTVSKQKHVLTGYSNRLHMEIHTTALNTKAMSWQADSSTQERLYALLGFFFNTASF